MAQPLKDAFDQMVVSRFMRNAQEQDWDYNTALAEAAQKGIVSNFNVRAYLSELKGSQQKALGEERRGAVSGAVTEAMSPRYAEVDIPGAPSRAVEDVSGLGLKTPEMPSRMAVDPGARTKEQIAGGALETWPTGRPTPTTAEFGEEPRYAAAPTGAELATQQYRTSREGRLAAKTELDEEWRKFKMEESRERRQQGWARIQNTMDRLGLSAEQRKTAIEAMLTESKADLQKMLKYGIPFTDEFGIEKYKEAGLSDRLALSESVRFLTEQLKTIEGTFPGTSPAPSQAPTPTPAAPAATPAAPVSRGGGF